MRTLPVTERFVTFNNSFKAENGTAKSSVSEINAENKKAEKNAKTGRYVTSALALAALVASGIAIARNPKAAEKTKDAGKDEISSKLKELEEKFTEKMTALEKSLKEATEKGDKEEIKKITGEIEDIKKWYDGWINDLQGKVEGVENRVRGIKDSFARETVNINGKDLSIASVVPEERVGASRMVNDVLVDDFEGARARMEKTLQTESLKRMTGINSGLKKIPESGWLRIPTSEYKGDASTGGMAIVPKEIAENLSRIFAGRQDIKVGVDMPLYLGNVERSSIKDTQKRLFNVLEYNPETKKFNYIQETYIKTGDKPEFLKERTVLEKLEKINTIHINDGVGKYDVDMYMTDSVIPVDLEEFMNIPGLKEVMDNSFSSFNKGLTSAEKEFLERVLPKESESYKAFKNGDYSKIRINDISLEEMTPVDKEVFDGLLKTKEVSYKNLIIRKSKLATTASVKVKKIFYDNGVGGKFDMSVAEDRASNIYNNSAVTSKETERFTAYFDKFFYSGLCDQKGKEKIGADAILGNDWQTGGIAAMLRQLTTVKKAYGEISPEMADKLYDTAVITLMHNASLSGGNWSMPEEILNIMYGRHAAEVVKNSYMPNLKVPGKTNGLDGRLFNGMMEGEGVNPQMMAIAYSDIIAPVSKGYADEISRSNVFGGVRRELFEFRARKGAYADDEVMKKILEENKVSAKPEEIKATLVGIANGCDRANNTLTKKIADSLSEKLSVPEGTFVPYKSGMDSLEWHNHNKMEGLNIIKRDIDIARTSGGKDNPMQIEMPEMTDLTGVTEKTPVFVSAGRIVDQKGLDIFAEGIKQFYKDYKGSDYPVFYIQGIGDAIYKDAILNVKAEVAKTNPEAAKRIVFANLFSEPGRYDCAKIISDFSVMPSWYEPCGLSHKEIGQFSGAIPVVNKTGGLFEDLTPDVNVIVSEYIPKHNLYEPPTAEILEADGKYFANAMKKAIDIHSNDAKYREMIDSMMSINLDWAREGGPIFDYIELMKRLNVLPH